MEREELLKRKQDLDRWSVSFIDFLFDCIRTTDEGNGEIKPAPRMRYLVETAKAIEENKITVLVKSRQMFFTHFMAAYYLWRVMFQDNVRLGIMNQREEDAVDLLETRVKPLYERLPEDYPWPKLEFKRLTITNKAMGSRIVAYASTSTQTRGKTFTMVWLDEFGFQENQEATLRSALPAVKGDIAKLVIVSTPKPKTLYQELADKELDPEFECKEIMQGMIHKRNLRGHAVLYIHHTADPNKRSPEWKEAVIKEEGELAYQVEYNLKWILPSGKPVFQEFDRQFYSRDYNKLGVLEDVALEEGWDFGGHHPAWVCAQRDPLGRLIVHKGVMGVDEDLYHFMDRIAEIRERLFPGMDYHIYCDPAGAAVNMQGTAPPAAQILAKRFNKNVRYIKSSPADRVRAVKQLMGKVIDGAPGLILNPMLGEAHYTDGQIESGLMIEGFEGGLVYEEMRGKNSVYKLSYKKDQWLEHLFDAFGYMFIFLYPGLMPASFEDRLRERRQLAEVSQKRRMQRKKMRFRR